MAEPREVRPGERPGRTPRIRGDEDGQGPASEPQLERKELVTGHQTGNVYLRVHRDRSGLRRLGAGHLEATVETLRPHGAVGRALFNIKSLVVGSPLATAQLAHERLTKVKALAVL